MHFKFDILALILLAHLVPIRAGLFGVANMPSNANDDDDNDGSSWIPFGPINTGGLGDCRCHHCLRPKPKPQCHCPFADSVFGIPCRGIERPKPKPKPRRSIPVFIDPLSGAWGSLDPIGSSAINVGTFGSRTASKPKKPAVIVRNDDPFYHPFVSEPTSDKSNSSNPTVEHNNSDGLFGSAGNDDVFGFGF